MIKCLYRVRHFCFGMVTRIFQKICPKIICGQDKILEISKLLKKENVDNVLVVTTKGFIKRKTLEPFFKTLDEDGIKYALFTDLTPDPTIDAIEDGVKVYKGNNCKAFVAIGGGSVIDCSKGISARIARPNKSIPKMKGLLKVLHKTPLFIAVPTTAGTGSEVTCASVVTDVKNGTHYKYPIEDYFLIPNYAILDPMLTISLPKEMTSTTGMDALTHAMEAYTNLFASKYVKKNALNAIKLIFDNLVLAYNEPENIKAREDLLLGSTYAGIAFTNNFVGYVHALAHAIGGIYGVAHGMANSILLVPTMRYYGKYVYKPLSEIADYVGISGKDNKEKAENLLDHIDDMKRKMDIPFTFNIKEEDYKEIVSRAYLEGNPTYPVPMIFDRNDFVNVLEIIREKL